MYARNDWERVELGRRIWDRTPQAKGVLCPGIVPEIVAWLRMIGNGYIQTLEGMQSRFATKGDSFLNTMRNTLEFRLAFLQDLITTTVEQFPLRSWWTAWYQTQTELGITDQDTNPNHYLYSPEYELGEGI